MQFRYDDAVLERFPTIRAATMFATGTTNDASPPDLLAELARAQIEARDAIGATPLSELASIAAWRQVFSGFGVSPTKYRNAAEALLRRLTKKDDVPSINLLVDLGNIVSIRHQVPVIVADIDRIDGDLTVRFATGKETFDDLGGAEAEHPDAGEVIFADDAGNVVARRWCWRQSTRSAMHPDTKRVFVGIEAHHAEAAATVLTALDDLVDLYARYQTEVSVSTGQTP